MQGRRPQCSSPQCKSPPSNVILLTCRPVVAQCIERLQHFNRTTVQNFNVASPFPPRACGSLGCHSVASPPRGRPWRLSPLVVQRIISISVLWNLCVTSLHANSFPCTLPYYILVLVFLSLYGISRLFIQPRFAEIWGRTSLCIGAGALYPAVDLPVRPGVHQCRTGNRRNCARASLSQLRRQGL